MSITFAIFILSSCSPKISTSDRGLQKFNYTYPMHPEVKSDKSDTYPKYGMDMVRSDAKGDHNHKGCKMKKNRDGTSRESDCAMM